MTLERRDSSIIFTNIAYIYSSHPSLTSRTTNITHLVRTHSHQFDIGNKHWLQILTLSYHGRRRTFIYLYATCYPLSLCNILSEAIFTCSLPVYPLMSPPSYLAKTNISVSVSRRPIESII